MIDSEEGLKLIYRNWVFLYFLFWRNTCIRCKIEVLIFSFSVKSETPKNSIKLIFVLIIFMHFQMIKPTNLSLKSSIDNRTIFFLEHKCFFWTSRIFKIFQHNNIFFSQCWLVSLQVFRKFSISYLSKRLYRERRWMKYCTMAII